MRAALVWGVPSMIGLAVIGVATVARGQDAGAPAGTDDTDVAASLPEVERPPPCPDGVEQVGEACVSLPVFVPVEAATARVGSPEDELGRGKDEAVREVEVEAFEIGTHEITQGQWQLIVGDNPSEACGAPVGPDLPVACVSWQEALRFCNALSVKMGLNPVYALEAGVPVWDRDADGVRLPTEAEWELAARTAEPSTLAGGDLPDAVAWYRDNAHGRAHAAASLRPTPSGVHDLSGNVAEWVWDGYAKDPEGADPAELDAAPVRVQKGGSFADAPRLLRVAARDMDRWDVTSTTVGFRVAR